MLQALTQRNLSYLLAGRNTAAAAAGLKAIGIRSVSVLPLDYKLKAAESELNRRRWSDVKEKVDEIKHLMNEAKTNRSIKCPNEALQLRALQEIEESLAKRHHEAYTNMMKLKMEIKADLYN